MQTTTGHFQVAHATEMTRFLRPSDLADFPRDPLPRQGIAPATVRDLALHPLEIQQEFLRECALSRKEPVKPLVQD